MNIRDVLKARLISHGLVLGVVNAYLFDTRECLLSGKYLEMAGTLMWDKIKRHSPTVIYGNGLAAIPLLSAIQMVASRDGYDLKTLLVRDSRKLRNLERIVEGPRPQKGERAVFVDDLMNSCQTFEKTKKLLLEDNIQVDIVACCTIIDFYRPHGTRRLKATGLPVESIFMRHDFGLTRTDSPNKIISKILWRNMSADQWPDIKFKTPPKIVGDYTYYANDKHEVYCHDTVTGDIIWTFKGPKPWVQKGLGAEIVVKGPHLYISSYDGSLYKLNSFTGELIWTKHLDMYLHSAPCLYKEKVYIATEGGIGLDRGDILCLDAHTGDTIWRFPTNHVVPASPEILRGQLVCGSNDGNLYSLDPHTGRLNWILKDVGEIKGRCAVLQDTILASSENGLMYGISLDGQILWTTRMGTKTYHQFIQVCHERGLAYTTNINGVVAAIDAYGNLRWTRTVRGGGHWNLLLRGDELLSITNKGSMDIICPDTGEKLGTEKLPYPVYCPADFTDKYIAVHSADQGLFLYERLS